MCWCLCCSTVRICSRARFFDFLYLFSWSFFSALLCVFCPSPFTKKRSWQPSPVEVLFRRSHEWAGWYFRRRREGDGEKRWAEKAGPENLDGALLCACRPTGVVFSIEQSEQMFQSDGMNQSTAETVTLNFTGQITVERETLVQLLRDAAPGPLVPMEARTPMSVPVVDGKLPRLAYSVRETAETLGISPGTVYRLLRRGLLRGSLACRNKMIAKTEIERFLKETSKSLW